MYCDPERCWHVGRHELRQTDRQQQSSRSRLISRTWPCRTRLRNAPPIASFASPTPLAQPLQNDQEGEGGRVHSDARGAEGVGAAGSRTGTSEHQSRSRGRRKRMKGMGGKGRTRRWSKNRRRDVQRRAEPQGGRDMEGRAGRRRSSWKTARRGASAQLQSASRYLPLGRRPGTARTQ